MTSLKDYKLHEGRNCHSFSTIPLHLDSRLAHCWVNVCCTDCSFLQLLMPWYHSSPWPRLPIFPLPFCSLSPSIFLLPHSLSFLLFCPAVATEVVMLHFWQSGPKRLLLPSLLYWWSIVLTWWFLYEFI